VKTKPGITRSTGEGKWAEETVLRQAELLRKTFDSMTDAIFVLDAKNPPTVLECNEAACRIFGYGKAEMLGKTTDFLHVSAGALREFQSQLYPAVEQGRLPFHLADYKMKRKDGSAFPSENLVSQLVDDKGVRTGWVSVVKDITESEAKRLCAAGPRNWLPFKRPCSISHDSEICLYCYKQSWSGRPGCSTRLAEDCTFVTPRNRNFAALYLTIRQRMLQGRYSCMVKGQQVPWRRLGSH